MCIRADADWGTSEWPAQMIQEARDHANRLGLVPPFFDQSHYNMLHRDREPKPFFSICILHKPRECPESADSVWCRVVIRRGD